MSETWFTVEPHPTNGFVLYEHGEYPRGSVLEGYPRKSYRKSYGSIQEALNDNQHLEIDVRDTPTFKPDLNMPDTPPDWFDPLDAGETW